MIHNWDGRRGEGHSGRVYSVAFSPDGHYLATGAVDKKAKIWDTRAPSGSLLAMKHSDLVNSVQFLGMKTAHKCSDACSSFLMRQWCSPMLWSSMMKNCTRKYGISNLGGNGNYKNRYDRTFLSLYNLLCSMLFTSYKIPSLPVGSLESQVFGRWQLGSLGFRWFVSVCMETHGWNHGSMSRASHGCCLDRNRLLFFNLVQEECAMTCPACLSLKGFEASCDLFTKMSSISNGVWSIFSMFFCIAHCGFQLFHCVVSLSYLST